MTDKQIIIDGIDVSSCKFFRNGICASPINPKCKLCIEINEKMCYFKQLTRKTQECDEFKEKYKWFDHYKEQALFNKNLCNEKSDKIDQLKAENEKYSFFIENLCDYIGLECDSEEQAMRTLSDFARQMNKARWIIDRYKQTLTEIKEIAKNSCCLQPTSTCEEYENCKECNRISDDETVKQIIQKISKWDA